MEIDFSKRKSELSYLKALQSCVSKDSLRSYLSAIYYDKEEKKLVATDGRVLLVKDWSQFPKDCEVLETSMFWKLVGKSLYSTAPCDHFVSWKRVIPKIDEMDKTDFKAPCALKPKTDKERGLLNMAALNWYAGHVSSDEKGIGFATKIANMLTTPFDTVYFRKNNNETPWMLSEGTPDKWNYCYAVIQPSVHD